MRICNKTRKTIPWTLPNTSKSRDKSLRVPAAEAAILDGNLSPIKMSLFNRGRLFQAREKIVNFLLALTRWNVCFAVWRLNGEFFALFWDFYFYWSLVTYIYAKVNVQKVRNCIWKPSLANVRTDWARRTWRLLKLRTKNFSSCTFICGKFLCKYLTTNKNSPEVL